MLVMWGAGTGGAVRGFDLKLQQLQGCRTKAQLSYLQSSALYAPLTSSLWISSLAWRVRWAGNDEEEEEDEDDDGSRLKEAGGRCLPSDTDGGFLQGSVTSHTWPQQHSEAHLAVSRLWLGLIHLHWSWLACWAEPAGRSLLSGVEIEEISWSPVSCCVDAAQDRKQVDV